MLARRRAAVTYRTTVEDWQELQQTFSETMLRLKRAQRLFLAEKLGDFANVAAGALIFGQALSGSRFSTPVALIGIIVWITTTGFALMLSAAEEV